MKANVMNICYLVLCYIEIQKKFRTVFLCPISFFSYNSFYRTPFCGLLGGGVMADKGVVQKIVKLHMTQSYEKFQRFILINKKIIYGYSP